MESKEVDAIQCPVCMENIEPEQEYCKLLCNHLFHPLCIQPWFLTKDSCPKCRFSPNHCQHDSKSPTHLGVYLFDEIDLLKDRIQKLEQDHKQQNAMSQSSIFGFRFDNRFIGDDEDPFASPLSSPSQAHQNIIGLPLPINIHELESMVRHSSQVLHVPPTSLPSEYNQRTRPQPVFHHNYH
jgi:RING finger family protein